MRLKHTMKNAMKKPLAFFLAVSIMLAFLMIPNGISPTVMANSVIDSPVSIQSLPSYEEHVQAGHNPIQNVTIAEYAAKYGTAQQYSSDYWLRIDTAEHLYQFSQLCNNADTRAHYLTLNYLLGNHIDYTAFYASQRKAFIPIGTAGEAGETPFTGRFDGQGFEIRNLIFVTDLDTVNLNRYFALFGSNRGTIRNFGLVNPVINTTSVIGGMFVSGIAGKNMNGGVIEFVYVDDTRVYSESNADGDNPGYRGASASFAGLVSINQAGATLSNAYYSGIVAESSCYAGSDNIRPAVLNNSGTLDEVYYNISLYRANGAATDIAAASNQAFVTVSADGAAKFAVGDTIRVGRVPYDSDIAEEKVITGINANGGNFNLVFSGNITTTVGQYVSNANVDPAVLQPFGSGTGSVIGAGTYSLETRLGCLTHSKWRTHAYEAVHSAGLNHMRSLPRLYGFSGYAPSGWGSTAPFLISTPADLVYFARFFEKNVTNVTTNRKYRINTCIDMSTVSPEAYYFNDLPGMGTNFSFSGEVDGADTCGHTHYTTTEGEAPNHAILGLTMTKPIRMETATYSAKTYTNIDLIGFFPGALNQNNGYYLSNLNFIGGLCQPEINPNSSALYVGTVAGMNSTRLTNVHSSMDITIPDVKLCPVFVGGIAGLDNYAVSYVSYSGKISGGIHPYTSHPEQNYCIGGIFGNIDSGAATYQHLLSDGEIEGFGFYNIPLVDGEYTQTYRQVITNTHTRYSGVFIGGVFSGPGTISSGSTGSVAASMTYLNRSDIYSVPMENETTPRAGPGGEKVYSLSPAIGGISAQSSGMNHGTAAYLINYGNFYCYNLIGYPSIGGIIGNSAEDSHGNYLNRLANYGNIFVSGSRGTLRLAGIFSHLDWTNANKLTELYNYGDLTLDATNEFSEVTVGGLAALSRESAANVGFLASEVLANYGDITVEIPGGVCALSAAGLVAFGRTGNTSPITNGMNDGTIRVKTAQTGGTVNVSGLSQVSLINSANRGAILVEATGGEAMSGDIVVGGLCGTASTTTAISFTNAVNAGAVEVGSNTAGTVYASGIQSQVIGGTAISECLNSGRITVKSTGSGGASVGGIAGYMGTNINRQILDSINSGAIEVTASGSVATHTGGIVGLTDSKQKINNCLNYGKVSSTTTNPTVAYQYTGGIAGKMTQGLATNEMSNKGGIRSLINFGAVSAVSAAANLSGVETGGITGNFTLTGTLTDFSDLINNGGVTAPSGSSFGSIAGRYDLAAKRITSASYLHNHLNTVPGLSLYGTAIALASNSTLTAFEHGGLYTVNSSDAFINTSVIPLVGEVKYVKGDETGLYDPDSEAAAKLTTGSFVLTPFDNLAEARRDDFPKGMYALTTLSQNTAYLPETMVMQKIDMPSLDPTANSAGIKDSSWRTEECLDIDGNPIPGSAPDDQHEFVKQVDNTPTIFSMKLESTRYYAYCKNCQSRFRADHQLEAHHIDTLNMSVAEMTAALSANSIPCANCGKAGEMEAVYSEYTIDEIQVRDNETNTLYFYTAENHIGHTFRISGWNTNFGTVVSDPNTAEPVEHLRFAMPDSYDGIEEIADLTQKVYVVFPGAETMEYTVVLRFIPGARIELESLAYAGQDDFINGGSNVSRTTVLAANLQRDIDGAYLVPEPIYYVGDHTSPKYPLLLNIRTDNLAPGYMPRYNVTITEDATGEDYTHYVKVDTDTDRFFFAAHSSRWTSFFDANTGTPRYYTTRAENSVGNFLYTEGRHATYPEGSYTIRYWMGGKEVLAVRFVREQNELGYPIGSAHYILDWDSKSVTRTGTIYGLAENPSYFFPLRASNRGGDVILYPGDRFGNDTDNTSINREGDRILVDVIQNPDGTHSYVNKISYVPEKGEAYKSWWTLYTHEALPPADALSISELHLNTTAHNGGTGFQVTLPSESQQNVVQFTGAYTGMEHANPTGSGSPKMYVEFSVRYFDGENTVELARMPSSSIYSPRFTMDGKTMLSIDQKKTKSANGQSVATASYQYTVTLDKAAPQGDYQVYFIYRNERELQLASFNETDKTYKENATSKTLTWEYEFPQPLTITKPLSTDSYLWSFNFPGTLLETIECTTPGHSHAQVATISGGVINYASSKHEDPGRDTDYDVHLYFPLGVSLVDKLFALHTAAGANVELLVNGDWVEVAHQHVVDFVTGESYKYRIEAQQKGVYTYYTFNIHNLPRNKTLNIEAAAGSGVTNLQNIFESTGDDLLISVKQLITDDLGNSQVYEMYNGSFVLNNGVHLPYSLPVVSSGTYVLDAYLPDGYGFEVFLGSAQQFATDRTVSGIKFTIGSLNIEQLVNITVRVTKLADGTRPDGLYSDWHSHRKIAKPAVTDTQFDVEFTSSGRLFRDILPEDYTNVILSPRQILGSNAPGTCFTQGDVVIPEGVHVTGDIFAKGNVVVRGTLTGNIWAEGDIDVYGSVFGFANAQGTARTHGAGVITGSV